MRRREVSLPRSERRNSKAPRERSVGRASLRSEKLTEDAGADESRCLEEEHGGCPSVGVVLDLGEEVVAVAEVHEDADGRAGNVTRQRDTTQHFLLTASSPGCLYGVFQA